MSTWPVENSSTLLPPSAQILPSEWGGVAFLRFGNCYIISVATTDANLAFQRELPWDTASSPLAWKEGRFP